MQPQHQELENTSFHTAAGSSVAFAFVGYTGSGESAVVALLARFYNASSGTILSADPSSPLTSQITAVASDL